MNSLLTVGQTVDEAAWLFVSLDHACHAQLMAEAAAANGVPKKSIPDDVAQYTADAAQNPVCLSISSCSGVLTSLAQLLHRVPAGV